MKNQSKIFLITMIIFTFIFNNCKKDSTNNPIIGKWGIINREFRSIDNFGKEQNFENIAVKSTDSTYLVLDFKSDNTLDFSQPNLKQVISTGNYSVSNNKIYMLIPGHTKKDTASFTINENKLTLIFSQFDGLWTNITTDIFIRK